MSQILLSCTSPDVRPYISYGHILTFFANTMYMVENLSITVRLPHRIITEIYGDIMFNKNNTTKSI